jgi:hypothetical protein
MRDGRFAGSQIAGQHRFGHQLQKRMQLVDIEAHRGGQRHRAATGIGALHVEHPLTYFLLAVSAEGQGFDIFGAGNHMRVAARQDHRITRIQPQPFAGRRLQKRRAGRDEMEASGILGGKSRGPGLGQAAAPVFDTIESQPSQHLRKRVGRRCG